MALQNWRPSSGEIQVAATELRPAKLFAAETVAEIPEAFRNSFVRGKTYICVFGDGGFCRFSVTASRRCCRCYILLIYPLPPSHHQTTKQHPFVRTHYNLTNEQERRPTRVSRAKGLKPFRKQAVNRWQAGRVINAAAYAAAQVEIRIPTWRTGCCVTSYADFCGFK